LTRATELIDQKQYSEAIFVLDDRLKKYPGDGKTRVMLASAYAARAGVDLSSYTSFASELQKWDQIDQLLPNEDDGPILNALDVVAKAAVRIELVVRAFDVVPAPSTSDGLADLNKAVQTLSDGGVLTAGPSIYRALLETAVFKNDLQNKYKLKQDVRCEVQSRDLQAWFQTVSQAVQSILNDVANGLTDATAVSKIHVISTEVQTDITAVTTVLQAPDTAATSLNLPPGLRQLYGQASPTCIQ